MMKPKKIILILIDTLRADHLGCYGYKRNTSPNIDKFAKEGILFKWPFAPISYTVPSITSISTGKYPSNHCTMFSNGPPVKSIETDVFLADILGSEGYETAAFVSSVVIGKVRKVAMTSGFNIYNDDMTFHEQNRLNELIRSGAETNEAAFKWLEKNFNSDFFLFVHYFDVHGPYVNPKPYDEIFVNDGYCGEPRFINKIVPDDKALGGIPDYQVLSPKRDAEDNLIDFEKDVRYYIANYDGGIRYSDEQIGNLFNKLRELGIYDDCLIILTSDHGEALGENNVYLYHGLTVTMDQIHVPLIIKPHTDWHPDIYLIRAPVSLVDIMPTILELVGYDFSELDIDGVSILDIEKNTNRKIISEIEPQIAYIDKSFIHLKPRDNLKEKKYFPYLKELCCEEKRFNYRKDPNRENNSIVLEWTGERYLPFVDPEISGAEIHYEHLHRYAFATQFVKGKKVLDFASGEGYGSYMLSKEAELVIGVEIDEKAVKHASSSYIRDNLEFMQGSILKVPIEGEKMFDAIICFEAIEHVEEHEELMKEVKRLLKADGIFIVSSPNKKVYTDDPDYHNPFHQKELYFDEFKNLLNNYFTNTNFFGQRVYTASNLWCLTSKEVPDYSEFVIKKGDDEFYFSDGKIPLYFIAVASNADLNERYNMSSSLVDASNILIEHYKGRINEFNVAIQGKDERISNLEGEITNISGELKEKEWQINDLDVAVQGKDAKISDLEGQITAISGQLIEKDKQLDELNVAVQGKDAQISDLEGEITNISGQLTEKYKQLDDLNATVQSKDVQMMDFEGQIADISDQLDEREQQINELNVAVQGKDAQIADFSDQLKDKKERIREIVIENVRLSSELNSMKTSVTWRIVMKWHLFVEKVMPQETNRRSRYDLGIIGLRTIANEGWMSFWWKYKQHIRQTKPLPKRKIKIDRISLPKEEYKDSNEILDAKVSVVIPTKNAGNDFVYVLDKLTNQEGLKELEIVAIDSGSTDDTIEIAKKYGVNVYQIKPDEFGHGKTRNLGAEKATGEFLLLITQDAILASKYLVYKMVNILKGDPKVAAVTCRQIPRSDADLMACFQVWSHYQKFLDINEDRVTSVKNMATITPLQKRKFANLSDSCCCIRRDLFSQYRFKTEFAEDLDLGIRFLDDGYKLAYLHSGAIIHSHNRIPSYFFKVSYTDSKVVSRIVGNAPLRWNTKDISVFYACIKKLYKKMIGAISIIEKESKNEINDIFTMLKESLNSDLAEKKPEDYTGDPSLDKLFNEIESIIDYYEKEQVEKTVYNVLLSAYLETLSTFNEYAMSYPSVFSIKSDFISTLYKLFANSLGASLGNFILFLYEKDVTTQAIEDLDNYLSGGV